MGLIRRVPTERTPTNNELQDKEEGFRTIGNRTKERRKLKTKCLFETLPSDEYQMSRAYSEHQHIQDVKFKSVRRLSFERKDSFRGIHF